MRQVRVSWICMVSLVVPTVASAYPPAVGILGESRDCLACHAENGPWVDEAGTIVDIVDAATGKSIGCDSFGLHLKSCMSSA